MGLETGTYINSLNSANPGANDQVSQGDDHIRLLKSTILATFPNITGAVTPTHTELNYVDGVTSAIQTQLNAKAPLASPAFTGDPTAPTPANTDNDTSIATTAFVKSVGHAYKAAYQAGLTVNTSLTVADHAGGCVNIWTAGITVTLPLMSGVPFGTTFKIKCDNSCIVTRSGSDAFSGLGYSGTSLTLKKGYTYEFISNGTDPTWYIHTVSNAGNPGWVPEQANAWVRCGVAGDVADSYNVSSVTDTGAGQATVNFATAMSNANYSVVATGVGRATVYVGTVGTSSFLMTNETDTATGGTKADPAVGYSAIVFSGF